MSKPIGPYRPIVRAGPFLVVSGQVGVNDGAMVTGGITAETRQAIANLRELLESEGFGLADVVKTTCFLLHMRDFGLMNEVYAEEFGSDFPARSTVAVAELPAGALFEIEAWAYAPA
jgi:2-iminobutanoate/2-iminopropanoate deaminase